jgi:hypothetical protein
MQQWDVAKCAHVCLVDEGHVALPRFDSGAFIKLVSMDRSNDHSGRLIHHVAGHSIKEETRAPSDQESGPFFPLLRIDSSWSNQPVPVTAK